jgi:PAS domain S-box-containing protein
MLESFFIYGALPDNVEKGVYQLPLVLLSYVVASFASYTALALAQQLVNSKSLAEKRLFHWGGAFAMGAGIWSMHFIGMLSYKMRMVVEYDPGLTLLSMFIAILVAYGVLAIVAGQKLSAWHILIGGVLLGLGICAMHYTGMAAMEMDADLRYVGDIFLLSVAIAIAASAAALWMAFKLARSSSGYRYLFQLAAALVMGAGICGMHYTGMWASVMIPYADCRYDPNQNFDMLALSIAGITGLILALALAAGIYKKTRIELQLQHSESKLRAMIDNAQDAVIGMDEQGRVTEWNKQAEAIFGWSHEEAVGTQMAAMIIPPEYRQAHHQGLQRFLSGGESTIMGRRIELPALNKWGKVLSVELTVTAQKLQQHYQFTAFIRDISDRKRSEEMMELLASIVQSSDDSIISNTMDGFITSWNSGAVQLFGYSAAEAVGQHISLIIPSERWAEEQQILAQLRTGKSLDHSETVRLHKDGRRIDVSLTVSPIYDASGLITGVSKVARDITKRKQTEDRLKTSLNEVIIAKKTAETALKDAQIEREKAELANRAKTEFLANMSHEIRTPLSTIIGTSELLAHTPLDAKQKEYAGALNTAGDMLLGLINNILDLSKIEAGEFNLLTLPIVVRALVEEIAQIMAELAQANHVTLEVVCADDVPLAILGDPLRLKQVVLNLTSNAVKFCTNGKVTIKVESIARSKNTATLRFSIEDTGAGIPADKLGFIFEKFTQLDDFSTKKYAGTGLGLAICKRLVEMMGGKINVSSTVG